jgi:hypothetical protein
VRLLRWLGDMWLSQGEASSIPLPNGTDVCLAMLPLNHESGGRSVVQIGSGPLSTPLLNELKPLKNTPIRAIYRNSRAWSKSPGNKGA